MLLLNRTHLALRILIHVGKFPDAPMTVQRISQDLSIPPQYAAKIVHEMVRADFLQSIRGRFGGVRLARPPRDIRVGDVVRSIETFRDAAPDPKRGGADIKTFFDESVAKFVEVLNLQSIEDFLPRRPSERSFGRPSPGKPGSRKASQQR